MLVVKEKEVSKLMEQLQALQEEGQKDSAAADAAEQHFKAVSAGLSTNEDGEEATLAGQMMTCKNDMSKADTEAKQVREKIQTCVFQRASPYSASGFQYFDAWLFAGKRFVMWSYLWKIIVTACFVTRTLSCLFPTFSPGPNDT